MPSVAFEGKNEIEWGQRLYLWMAVLVIFKLVRSAKKINAWGIFHSGKLIPKKMQAYAYKWNLLEFFGRVPQLSHEPHPSHALVLEATTNTFRILEKTFFFMQCSSNSCRWGLQGNGWWSILNWNEHWSASWDFTLIWNTACPSKETLCVYVGFRGCRAWWTLAAGPEFSRKPSSEAEVLFEFKMHFL